MEQNKQINIYSKELIIKMVAHQTGYPVETVRQIYRQLDAVVFDALASANEHTDIIVKLFSGVTMSSEYIPSKYQMNNLIGQMVETASKIKPKVTINRSYKNQINQRQRTRYNRQ